MTGVIVFLSCHFVCFVGKSWREIMTILLVGSSIFEAWTRARDLAPGHAVVKRIGATLCRQDLYVEIFLKRLAPGRKICIEQFIRCRKCILSIVLPHGFVTLYHIWRWPRVPTVLAILGWRLFFFANENKEPMHIHARKGDMECKYWLFPDRFETEEEFTYGMGPKDVREVRKIIYEHFDYIVAAWNEFAARRVP